MIFPPSWLTYPHFYKSLGSDLHLRQRFPSLHVNYFFLEESELNSRSGFICQFYIVNFTRISRTYQRTIDRWKHNLSQVLSGTSVPIFILVSMAPYLPSTETSVPCSQGSLVHVSNRCLPMTVIFTKPQWDDNHPHSFQFILRIFPYLKLFLHLTKIKPFLTTEPLCQVYSLDFKFHLSNEFWFPCVRGFCFTC